MVSLKIFSTLILLAFLSSCPFDDNREIEKKLVQSEIEFHNLYNQGNFRQIYAEADDKLKAEITEQQFISYIESVKNTIGKLDKKPIVWIDDELKDGLERLFIKRTKFSNVEIVGNEKTIYREKFDWNLKNDEVKVASYKVEKMCDKPCALVINEK